MYVKNKYKIHGLSTATGEGRATGTTRFYETLEEAQDAAQGFLHDFSNCSGIVVYEAIEVHTLARSPISIQKVR